MKGYKFSERSTKSGEVIDVHYKGKNIAYVRVKPLKKQNVAYVDSLYVRPEHRRRGLSHQLLEKVVEKYKDRELRLQADPFKDKPVSVTKLKKLYAEHGFESIGRWQMVREPMSKQAGGNIIGGLAGLLSRPFVGAERSGQLRDKIIGGITKHVNQPIEDALHRSGVRDAISKAYQFSTRPVPGPLGKKVIPGIGQPYMPHPEQRRAYGNWRADDIVHTIAHNPEAAVLPAAPLVSPVLAAFPTTSTYLGTKAVAGRALGVKKLAAFGDELEKIAEVLPYQQETQWTCSAACMKAVLQHHGIEISESEAVAMIGARPGRGAECNEIADAARAMSLDAFEYSFDSLDQAKTLLDQDLPIICDIQSFNNPGKGHYVVMVGIDNTHVKLMDPNTPGNQRVISREEMDSRWWDRAMAPPHELMPKHGIIILPRE